MNEYREADLAMAAMIKVATSMWLEYSNRRNDVDANAVVRELNRCLEAFMEAVNIGAEELDWQIEKLKEEYDEHGSD